MKMQDMVSKSLLVTLLTAGLGACGTTGSHYQPIVDGQVKERYYADLQACQQLSEQREYFNDDVKSEALFGAIVGAAVGALDDGKDGAVEGALVGGAAHAIGKAWDTRYERKQIIVECLKQRGHRVVG